MLKINDADNFRRTVAGLCLIAAPLVVLIGGLVPQWEANDTLAAYLQTLGENPVRAQVSAVLLYFGFLLFVPGIFGMIHLVKDRGVVLAHIAGVLAVWGWVTLPGLLVTDFISLSLVESLDLRQAVAVSERSMSYPGAIFFGVPVMLGTLGTVLLVFTLWRARFAPLWVPVVVFVGSALEFYPPPSVLPSGISFAISNVLWLAALGYVGLKILGMSDEEWKHGESPVAEPVGVGAQPRVQ